MEQARRCGPCTACCDGWLKIVVYGHEIRPGKPCPFSSGGHCTIYQTRPKDPCRDFVCGWLTPTSPLPDWMRPDRAHVIFLPANFTWHGHSVDVAVPVGAGPTGQALDWLRAFAAANKRPLLYQVEDEWHAFGPPAFQSEMRERINAGSTPWV